MLFLEDVIQIFGSNIECVGLFQKKNQGGWGNTFLNPPPPLSSPGNSTKLCLIPWKISKTKIQDTWKFHTIFSSSPLEFHFVTLVWNSTSFLINSSKFHMLFLRYPWNCPWNIQVMCIECLRRQWHTGELFYYQWPPFHHIIWEG